MLFCVDVFYGLWLHTVAINNLSLSLSLSLSFRFNGHFPSEPGLAGFIGAKVDGDGGDN